MHASLSAGARAPVSLYTSPVRLPYLGGGAAAVALDGIAVRGDRLAHDEHVLMMVGMVGSSELRGGGRRVGFLVRLVRLVRSAGKRMVVARVDPVAHAPWRRCGTGPGRRRTGRGSPPSRLLWDETATRLMSGGWDGSGKRGCVFMGGSVCDRAQRETTWAQYRGPGRSTTRRSSTWGAGRGTSSSAGGCASWSGCCPRRRARRTRP